MRKSYHPEIASLAIVPRWAVSPSLLRPDEVCEKAIEIANVAESFLEVDDAQHRSPDREAPAAAQEVAIELADAENGQDRVLELFLFENKPRRHRR